MICVFDLDSITVHLFYLNTILNNVQCLINFNARIIYDADSIKKYLKQYLFKESYQNKECSS